jgi:hypothetical protein
MSLSELENEADAVIGWFRMDEDEGKKQRSLLIIDLWMSHHIHRGCLSRKDGYDGTGDPEGVEVHVKFLGNLVKSPAGEGEGSLALGLGGARKELDPDALSV